jgi:hypothetical protein
MEGGGREKEVAALSSIERPGRGCGGVLADVGWWFAGSQLTAAAGGVERR